MKILIVEDDNIVQRSLAIAFEGHELVMVETAEAALENLRQVPFHLLILDIKLAGKKTGIDVLREAVTIDPLLPVAMASSLNDGGTQRRCLELGAFDFINKDHMAFEGYRDLIHKASVWRSRQIRNSLNHKNVSEPEETVDQIILGDSPKIAALRERLTTIGSTNGPFLISGETGTGKELIAKSLWLCKRNAARPFITVNCAELQASTIESELFGYEKGAFTGANSQRVGLFEAAHGGDIFLDEIGELPLEFQAKLLRVLQEKKIRRMGSNVERTFDFRIIAATNRNLNDEVENGKFRADLLFRLKVHALHNPPLRERREDIFSLLEHFLAKEGFSLTRVSPDIKSNIINHRWKGNVRALRAFATSTAPHLDILDPQLSKKHWDAWTCQNDESELNNLNATSIFELLESGQFNYDDQEREFRNECVRVALKLHDNNVTQAARSLQVHRQRLQKWIS